MFEHLLLIARRAFAVVFVLLAIYAGRKKDIQHATFYLAWAILCSL